MKKLVLVGLAVSLFSGCSIETLYLTGEAVGKKVLPAEVKEEIKPYNEAIKDGYTVFKKGNDEAVTTSIVVEP